MMCMVFLGLIVLTYAVSSAPCEDCYVVKATDESFEPAVTLLKKTLTNLAAIEDGPFFKLVKAHSVALVPYYIYPIVTADLQDEGEEIQHCDVKIFKPLALEDYTTDFKVIFYCEYFELIKNVTLNEDTEFVLNQNCDDCHLNIQFDLNVIRNRLKKLNQLDEIEGAIELLFDKFNELLKYMNPNKLKKGTVKK